MGLVRQGLLFGFGSSILMCGRLDNRIWLQVFGFLLGIDLKGMSGGPGDAGEDGEDQMKDVPTPPPATQAQGEAAQAKEEEEEEVRFCRHDSVLFALVTYCW